MRRRQAPWAVAVVGLVGPLLVAGCSGAGAEDGRPRVVAGFYPLEYVAARIAGEHASVAGLTTPGAQPHDVELTVQQRGEVSEADLAVYDASLQPVVAEAVDQSSPAHVVETSDLLSPDDPHFWLDATSLVQVGRGVERALSDADPDHAESFRENFERLRSDLESIDTAYARGLESCALDTVVVSHDAFGALERYGLRFEAINGISPNAEPSPARVAALRDLVVDAGVSTVFSETLASPELAQTLAADASVDTAVLDPIEGLGETTSGEDYLSLMRANLAALRTANRCT